MKNEVQSLKFNSSIPLPSTYEKLSKTVYFPVELFNV